MNILYGLIGGLLFKTENDKFQCTPILWGDPSTFKSCILNIIALFFNFIGTITSTYEPIFGLSGLYDKEVIINFDMPQNFHKLLNESDFKNMVDGQYTGLAYKNGKSASAIWNNRMIGATNLAFLYGTAQFYKRAAIFPFFEEVLEQDSELQDKSIETELMNFLNKCLIQYHELKKNKESFEAWRPQFFKDAIERMDSEANAYVDFLIWTNILID